MSIKIVIDSVHNFHRKIDYYSFLDLDVCFYACRISVYRGKYFSLLASLGYDFRNQRFLRENPNSQPHFAKKLIRAAIIVLPDLESWESLHGHINEV